MTQTLTLTGFLLARIADDEAELQCEQLETTTYGDLARGERTVTPGRPLTAPESRRLAECEAKRRIVELHGPANLEDDGSVDPYASPDNARYCRGCNANFVERYASLIDECPTKRLLALPYADHPDYAPEWATIE